jgi:hypothetical protein
MDHPDVQVQAIRQVLPSEQQRENDLVNEILTALLANLLPEELLDEACH